eukprot:jgi/Psemu1/301924/fgenesh1_kg.51_\
MPPYSESANGDNDGDGYDAGLQRKHRAIDLGFTDPLMESISSFKTKIQTWVEHEKSSADRRFESYNKSLIQQQAIIDSQIKELNNIQRERGISSDVSVGESENCDDSANRLENIASRKKALEEASTKTQVEIMKLKTERDNREKRVKDVSLEESKQRIRASDAAALKRQVEESKNTTIDDLTRGVINYKKMGVDFQRTGKDGELQFKFDHVDVNDPSRPFSFTLFLNDDDYYGVSDCDPKIDPEALANILAETNASSDRDNMPTLARLMRRAFKVVCKDV